jgi:hypothetical protein
MSKAFMTALPPFNPKQISGCQLWLDGADPAGTGVAPANGATVTSWTDKSGSGNSVTLPSLTYSLNTYTGYSGVVFTSGTASSQLTLRPYDCFFASSYSTGPYFPTSYPGLLGETAVVMFGNYWSGVSANIMGTGGGFNNYSVGTFGNVVGDSRNMIVSTSFSTPSSSFTLRVGSGDGYPTNSWLGHIYEVIVFNVALSTAQRKQIEGYLAQKWGLRSYLPSTHPGQTGIIYPTIARPLATPLVYPSTFTPTSIGNCSMWLDGADPAGTGIAPSSGATVTSWIDKSTTANNFTGSASYSLDSTYNKYGLLFTGSTYFSQVNGSKYSITNTTYTILTVHRFTNDTVSVGEVYRSNNISGFWFRQQGTGVNWITDTDPAGYVNVSGASSVVSGIGCINTLTTSSATAYINGSSVGSSSRGTTTNITFHIGAISGGEYLQGTIFEMLIYNITLSSTQQQQVEGYLAWKWGLQGSLPANHAYKSSSPSITNALGITRPTYVASVVPTPVTKIVPTSKLVIATGGNTVVTANGYKIHTFTTVGSAANFVVSANPANTLFQVLVAAGGGGGGGAYTGGGGGAGGAVFTSVGSFSVGSYTVTVGSGGAGWTGGTTGTGDKGGNSSVNSIVAYGGGGGGDANDASYNSYMDGGCGGGGGGPAYTTYVGVGSQGGNGGAGYGPGGGFAGTGCGGGGGMGGKGVDCVSGQSGAGGPGATYTIGGSSYLICGGGGGGGFTSGGYTRGLGGSGIGGAGGTMNTTNGYAATYYGSGGGGSPGNSAPGGNGYQGLVIIAYQYP